jgi:hypothetical protein
MDDFIKDDNYLPIFWNANISELVGAIMKLLNL